MDPIIINAVIVQRDGMWVAQCLEYNFVSCAGTMDDLPRALLQQVVAQIQIDVADGHEPFFEFQPAPAKYWDMYEKARLQSEPIRKTCSLPERKSVETQLYPLADAA
jgi:hypothetical protein